ncbi:MAG: helix-turn-helix transcriptional regulator [Nitriliruptorales bacterium]
MKRPRTLLPQTRDAISVLGLLVAEGRRRRGWTEQELAERVGVTPKTLRKVETGDGTVALETAFEAAALVGVPLFAEREDLPGLRDRTADRLALLPHRVRIDREDEADDDF